MGLIPNAEIKELAGQVGFVLSGVARAAPSEDYLLYQQWVTEGMAGRMGYLTDHRGEARADPRSLLATARSVVCVAIPYRGPELYSTQFSLGDRGWISRYAWGNDYHDVLRRGLAELVRRMRLRWRDFDAKICVDTAPLLERSYARMAGLGWIGKNTCLIREGAGSWLFLGELLTSLEIEPDSPPPDRCGTCRRCIDACPTAAIVPAGDGRFTLDARLCISYFTIELRGAVPEEHRARMGQHLFGCDICQDVCPWNRKAPVDRDPALAPRQVAPALQEMAALSEQEFREMFRGSPVTRARYAGFLRNVAIAMGNSGLVKFRAPLERLAGSGDAVVAEAAAWALAMLPPEGVTGPRVQ